MQRGPIRRTPALKIRSGAKAAWIAGTLLAIILVLSCSIIALAHLGSASDEKGLFTTTVDPKRHLILDAESSEQEEIPTLAASLWNVFALSGMRAAALQVFESVVHPGTKVVMIYPGMRKEEVAELFAKKLAWDSKEKQRFVSFSPDLSINKAEGYFYPDIYKVAASSTAESVHEAVVQRFADEVRSRYPTSTANIVNVDLALTIASIIQREAAGKHDMALISGVIWNRLFKDMTLDMDATLQYAKGSEKIGWWPRVVSEDKYIDSPYNTYQNGGLPPTPIANPSLAAINAALNPKKTSALFYIHDRQRRSHTAKTYKEHKANIRKYY